VVSVDSRSKSSANAEIADDASFMNVDDISKVYTALGQRNKSALMQEQQADESLMNAFKLACQNRGNYLLKEGLLFRNENYCSQELINLVVPKSRRLSVLQLAYDTCQFADKRTYERILLLGLTWGAGTEAGSVRTDSIEYAAKCPTCQMYARTTCFDRVPIKAVILS
jgi:hypothetical protein